MSEHLVELSSRWGLWRCAVLRGAGFPAHLVQRISTPELAGPIDRLFAAEHDAGTAELQAARDDYATTFAAARVRIAREVQDLVSDSRFREAITWQNRSAIATALEPLRRADTAKLRTKDRQHEALVVNYLHRYCVKNDTIGFFGPVGWATWDGTSDVRVVVVPGKELVDKREVFFELWGIDALAEWMTERWPIRPWLAPRRFGFVRLAGAVAHSPLDGPQTLSRALALVLEACDGVSSAREIATRLREAQPALFVDEASVFDALSSLADTKLIAWRLEVRASWHPERALRAAVMRIGDASLRTELLRPLEELETARHQIAESAGDPEKLAHAIDDLEHAFGRITGASATRHHGKMYVGRQLIFEDCRRAGTVVLGGPLLDELGPALTLVLDSARWFAWEVSRGYDEILRKSYLELVGKFGARVPLSELWYRVQRFIFGARDRPIDRVADRVRSKWDEILDPTSDPRRIQRTSAALRPLVDAAFAAADPGWAMARHHSPDLMLCARSADALARGEYLAVLGEIHVTQNTMGLGLFVHQHPAPAQLSAWESADLPETILISPQGRATGDAIRVFPQLVTARRFDVETGFDPSPLPHDRVLRVADLVVAPDGARLGVFSADGRVRVPLIEMFGPRIADRMYGALAFGSDSPHAPRITIDRMVIRRESWLVLPSELGFAFAKSEQEIFLGANRWARILGLPRTVFVKSAHERKPIYVSFDSPISVFIFAKIVRSAKDQVLRVTEMLPDSNDTWLANASGETFTSEFRLVACDLSGRPTSS